jgi:hypothetical protein
MLFLVCENEYTLTNQLLLQQVLMILLRRTSMTTDTRTLLHTHRLQSLPLQAPLLPRHHPGETALKEKIATGMAIAVVRILHHFHWHICIQRSTGMHIIWRFFFSITSSTSLGIPACLDHKTALDSRFPYLEARL